MADLPRYSNHTDKINAFISSHQKIDTKLDIDTLFSRYSSINNTIIFRGCNDAKFKLYSSGQRYWATHELGNISLTYKDFIGKEIINAKQWQDNVLSKFYQSFGLSAFDLLVLSFLQHYGAPTPILDWSFDFRAGLYFGTDGLRITGSGNSIDNYFSVYRLDLSETNLPNLIEIRDTQVFDDDVTTYFNDAYSLNSIFNKKLFYFSSKTIPASSARSITWKTLIALVEGQNNLNIINQNGLFIFNGSETNPLETLIPKIHCIDIHKNLAEYVRRKLLAITPVPFDKDFIYPQEEIIAKKAFETFLNS